MAPPGDDDSWDDTASLGSSDENVARAAYDRLVKRLKPSLLALIQRRVGRNTGIAEEICQECFLKLWTKREKVSAATSGSPFNWLSTVARNKVTDGRRRGGAQKRGGAQPTLSLSDPVVGGTVRSSGPSPERDALMAEAFRRALSPTERVIVALKLDDHSETEIAAHMGCELVALRTKLAIIRDKLQRNGLASPRASKHRQVPHGEALDHGERG